MVLALLLPAALGCAADRDDGDWARLAFYREANAQLGPSSRIRVVFIGDSITEGWAAQPAFKNNPDFIGRGIGGQTLPQMLVRFRADAIELQPAVIHIMGGTNDVAENTGPESDAEIQGYVTSMVELARAHGIKVVLASIPPASDFTWRPGLNPAPRIKRLNTWYQDYARRQGLVYVDYASILATPDGGMKPEFSLDGVHPNAAGYAAMQPLVSAAIRQALGEATPAPHPSSCQIEKTAPIALSSPSDTLNVAVAGTACHEATLTITIKDQGGATLYEYSAPFKRHTAVAWDDPNLGKVAEALVDDILAPSDERMTAELPAWAPKDQYYEDYYEEIQVTKERYNELRKQKLPIFRHLTHYEGWQRVIFDPSSKKAVVILTGGL
jgi:lysophospholipase L1-like esterase